MFSQLFLDHDPDLPRLCHGHVCGLWFPFVFINKCLINDNNILEKLYL